MAALPFLSVFIGAGFGACLRWWPDLRLFVITGFLGGLTTFSTFSSEVVNLLGEAQFGWALAAIGAHMLGSFAATGVGIFSMRAVLRGIG
jgi:fluoride exporter